MRHPCKRIAASALLSMTILLTNCSKPEAPPPAQVEPEAISRTEFTNRVENYFEYEPLRSGKASQVRIHLTDLSDGSAVVKANASLVIRPKGSAGTMIETISRVGKVTGIYVAELNIPKPGDYDIEFHIKNEKLDERMPLSNFKVE